MTDLFGLTELPVQVPAAATDVVSDPLLQYLGDFVKAALNRIGNDAWHERAPGRNVVDFVFYHNPQDLFDESRLPAIYLWESSSAQVQNADDVLTQARTLSLYWVAEPAQEAIQMARLPFRNAIGKALMSILKRQRDPAWIVAGDTDTLAPIQGSYLATYCGYNKLARGPARELSLDVRIVDGDGNRMLFQGVATELAVEEIVTFSNEPFTESSALDATITSNGAEIGWVYDPSDDLVTFGNWPVHFEGVQVTYA